MFKLNSFGGRPVAWGKSAIIAGILTVAFSSAARADAETDPMVIKVESTTIDDRYNAKEKEPSSVEVISGEQVDKAHTENIQQLLKSIPGLTTEIQSGDSIKIHLRGVENQRYMGEKPGVAIVIDGVPVFERTGRVNIDLDNIESIKVIKGGASYLFGEDALSGAVIITTKRGAKMAGYLLGAEAGSYGFQKEIARAGYSSGKMNAHIQASGRKSDGYHDQSDYQANYVDGKLQYFLNDHSDMTFGFENSDRKKDSHGTVVGVTQAKNDPKSQSPDAGRDYARMYDVGLAKYYLTYTNDLSQTSALQLNVYHFGDDTLFYSAPQYYDAKGNAVSNADAYTTRNDYHQVQRGVKGEWRSGGEVTAFMAGLDARANQYNNKTAYVVDFKQAAKSPKVFTAGSVTGDNKTDESVYAAYGEAKYNPFAPLTLTANARMDQIKLDYTDHLNKINLDKTFNVQSFRAGANYKMTEAWEGYANVSTGFRAPTIDQLFSGTISPTGSVESNPGLKPERSMNYEAGVRSRASVGGLAVDWDLAAFQIDREDFILNVAGQYSVAEKDAKDRYENIGGVRNRGVELSARTDAAKMVSFDMAYTYLNAEFTNYDNFNLILGNRYMNPKIEHYDNTGNRVPRTPDHHLNLTGRVNPYEGLVAALELDAISSYYADEMNLVKIEGHETYSFLLNYDFSWGRGKWALFARIDNLLDKRYYATARGGADSNQDMTFNAEDISITVNPGRIYTAGVSAAF